MSEEKKSKQKIVVKILDNNATDGFNKKLINLVVLLNKHQQKKQKHFSFGR